MRQLVSKSFHVHYNVCYKHFLYPKLCKRLCGNLAGLFVLTLCKKCSVSSLFDVISMVVQAQITSCFTFTDVL